MGNMMPYTSRFNGPLTPEEQDVRAALRLCTTEGATPHDWTPTGNLWQTYCTWHAEHRSKFNPYHPEQLTRRQFGRAVRRVFPGVMRRKRGRVRQEQWGYAGMLSPFSVRLLRGSGLPDGAPHCDRAERV